MKPDLEIKHYRENVDAWIKEIRKEHSNFLELEEVVNENVDNIQHNYELLFELKDQVDNLKQDINFIKIILLDRLKQNANR